MAIITSPDVLRHIVDVHVHPTDSEISNEAMENLAIKICAMSTMKSDQSLVRDLATKYPEKVVPCFGELPQKIVKLKSDPCPVRLPPLVHAPDSNKPPGVERTALSGSIGASKPYL